MHKIFGKEEILTILEKRLDGFKKGYRQNIALIGRPNTGKTFIIQRLLANADCSQILPIALELNGRSLKQLIRIFTGQILRHFLKTQGIDAASDLTHLIEKSQAFLPKTIAKIKSIEHNLDKDKKRLALLETFDLPQAFFEEANIPCLVILDEFQQLGGLGVEDIFIELGKKIPLHKNTMYLIASSSTIKAREILSQGLSLLFGNFEVIEVKPFTISVSGKFIDMHLPQQISETYKKFLIYISSGHPFYLDILCRELTLAASEDKNSSITENLFIRAFENLLFEEWGIFYQKFIDILDQLSSDKQREDHIAILSGIIRGYNKVKTIAEYLGNKEKNIQQRLARLCENGIIFKNGDFLCLADKLFGFWIESAYNKKFGFDYFDENALRENFKESLLNTMNNFSVVSEKALIERIIGLFNLFKNEVIQFDRKKIVLSHFKEISLLPINTGSFNALISAKAQDSFWVIAVKNGELTEKDVAYFISECKRFKGQVSQRRIIISLDKIDTNAKLKALEGKIIAWEAPELNSLLELYNQPIIFA
ncbi:MAG: hypothetical protein Q8L26_06710 [Candidatus Omnitrophota bacterium]|nr:hypothetical protein [Candidatus Omnitrophota bacterium]